MAGGTSGVAWAPHVTNAALRAQFVRASYSPPHTRTAAQHYGAFKRGPLMAAAAVAATKFGAAGFAVIDLAKFYVHPGCPEPIAKHCVTGDGTHPAAPTNVAMAWELWSTVAAAIGAP